MSMINTNDRYIEGEASKANTILRRAKAAGTAYINSELRFCELEAIMVSNQKAPATKQILIIMCSGAWHLMSVLHPHSGNNFTQTQNIVFVSEGALGAGGAPCPDFAG